MSPQTPRNRQPRHPPSKVKGFGRTLLHRVLPGSNHPAQLGSQGSRRCYEAMKGGWKDRRHTSWLSSLENHVFPEIGARRIDAINSTLVLKVLEPIWTVIPDTARRILQRIGTVLDYGHIKGHIPAEVSLRSVTRGLPRQTRQASHRAAMPYADVPAFLKALSRQENSTGRDALKLTILTAVRSNEARFATVAVTSALD